MSDIQIKELNASIYTGKQFVVEYETDGYFDLIKEDFSFTFVFKKLAKVEKRGFKVKLADNIYSSNRYLAGSDKERLDAIHKIVKRKCRLVV